MAAGVNVQEKIENIMQSKATINAKLVELGVATGTDDLEAMATKMGNIENRGAVSATVVEGQTYTIPKGYHNGSGTVTGLSDAEGDAVAYRLQSKTTTPTKEQQNVTPDSGYYGLSDVTVAPIPDKYQDVSDVTADAENVLTGKRFVTSKGILTTGTMPNIGGVTVSLTGLSDSTSSYTIPKGYHDGTGTVSLTNDIENMLAEI